MEVSRKIKERYPNNSFMIGNFLTKMVAMSLNINHNSVHLEIMLILQRVDPASVALAEQERSYQMGFLELA